MRMAGDRVKILPGGRFSAEVHGLTRGVLRAAGLKAMFRVEDAQLLVPRDHVPDVVALARRLHRPVEVHPDLRQRGAVLHQNHGGVLVDHQADQDDEGGLW